MKLSELQGAPAPRMKLSDFMKGEQFGPSIISPRAQALKETISGTGGVGQREGFQNAEQIAARLRSEGQTDAEIEGNPEWQTAAKNLSRAVSSGVTGTALSAAIGEWFAGPAMEQAIPAATRAIRAFAPKLQTVGEPTTASPLGDMLRQSVTGRLGELNEGQATQFEQAFKNLGVDPYTEKASDLAGKIFKDRDTVTVFKRLAGDTDWLENHAGVYAATKLKEATEGTGLLETHASRAASWAAKNHDWLNEFPAVNDAVQKYISGLRRMAVAKGAGTLAGASFLPHWMRRGLEWLP